MSQVKTIAADLSEEIRRQILSRFPIVHPNIYAKHVTKFYGKIKGSGAPTIGTAVVTGIVANDRYQVLVLRVNGEDFRPDGKPYHLTISTADGVPPKECGDLLLDDVVDVSEFRFPVYFRLRNARVVQPDRYEYE